MQGGNFLPHPALECAVGSRWDLRNSQILHLVKAYKEGRCEAQAKSNSQEPFFDERELEFFRLVEEGQVYDYYFAKALSESPRGDAAWRRGGIGSFPGKVY